MAAEHLESYRLLARNFPSGCVCLFDTGLRYLVADGDLIRHSPFGSVAFEGRHPEEIFPPEVCATFLPQLQEALAGREVVFETRVGGYVMHHVARPVRDGGGEIVAVLLLVHDITGQRVAEDALRASERRFRALFEHSGDGITLIDSQARVLFETPSAHRIWGRTGQEPRPADPFDTVHPDDRAAANELLGALLAHPGASVTFRCRIRHGDGSWHWCDTIATNLLEQPDVGAIVVNHRDVHDRVRAEEALRLLSEGTAASVGRAFFRDLVAGLSSQLGLRWAFAAELIDGGERLRVLAMRRDGALLEDMRLDLAGTPCVAVADGHEAHHAEGMRARFPAAATLLALGPVESYFGVPLLGDDGRPVGLLAVLHDQPLHDVTHLRSIMRVFAARAASELVRMRAQQALERSEELNRRLLAAVPAGMVRIGADGSLLHANALAQKFLGLSWDQLGQRFVTDFATVTVWEDGEVCPVEAFPVSLCLATGEPSGPTTLGVRRPDDEVSWGIFTAHPLGGPSGSPGGAVVCILDITERKRLEDQLRHSQKMDAIGKLAGGVAHDFNNLLTVILGRSELLLERLPKGDRTRDDIQLFHRTATRAAGLTRQLLAISRQQVSDATVVDVNRVVTHMADLLRGLIGERIDLRTQLEPRLGRVVADPSHLEQVILNLCVNARDAMPEGGTVVIQTANAEVRQPTAELPVGRYVLLAVKDTGHGIDPRLQSRIFEPFFTTKPGGKGTGLGLSTVFGIARQHGGAVTVRSEPGQGATFFVYLPRSDAPADPSGPQQTLRDDGGGTETVLLVEDHDELREMVAALLGGRGYQVIPARDAREGLDRLAAHPGPVHLLITDLVMPGMNGREFAAHAAARRPDLKVLYVSGYTDEPFSPEPGAGFLQKPFSSDALAHAVRTLLDAAKT